MEYLSPVLLPFLPSVLITEVVDFCRLIQYHSQPADVWILADSYPTGLISHSKYLYICDYTHDRILTIQRKNGKMISDPILNENPYCATAIDIDPTTNLIYAVTHSYVCILNLKKEKINSWILHYNEGASRGIKINNKIIYLTIFNRNEIFLFNKDNGTLIKYYGTLVRGDGKGAFHQPLGITINENNLLFVCDMFNNRIQVLTQEGEYHAEWGEKGYENGEFTLPYSIYYLHGIIYVGDINSIQLFYEDSEFIQRLGDQETTLNRVEGLLAMGDLLYACDAVNGRIVIFRAKK